MGLFNVKVTIANRDSLERRASVDALVDTGAFISAIPASILHELGVSPMRRQTLRFADGSMKSMDLGEVFIQVDGREATTQVMFGAEDAQPLLGRLTLGGLLLDVDPIRRRLVPMGDIIWGR